MGKSIVHCAECGNAIREEDFAKGKASIVDSRNYCSTCRAVSPSSSRNLDLRKSSTARLALPSGVTPRRGTPVVSGKSRAPLIAAGVLTGIGLMVLLVFVFSRKGDPAPVAPGVEKPVAAKPVAASPRIATPAEPKPQEEPKPAAAAEPPVAKPVVVEKIPPPAPRLTDPLDGSNFGASADIPIEAQTRDPKGQIARVEFWQGATKLGESADVPYRFVWKGARAAGTYELKAKSIDRDGAEAASETVHITIKPDAEPAKEPAVPETPSPAVVAEAGKDGPAPAEKKPEPKKEVVPQVDQKKIDLAIKKGTQYLVGLVGKMTPAFAKEPNRECSENGLVLWTFVHAGVPESSTGFKFLFKSVTEGEFRRTYEVALESMILEEVDRVRYQERLQQCAQFLVDNQCRNGQWSYGEPPSKDTPTIYGALPVPTGNRPAPGPTGERQKPLVVKKVKVTPRRTGPAEGDNSNAQYAALGIRACADAGIEFPEDVLRRARQWFWGAQHPAEGPAGVATGADASAPPKGWCYTSYAAWDHHHGSYGSMTAGAVGALAIYDTLLGEDWRKDAGIASGLSWLARNFSVSGNPGPPSEEWAKNDTKWCHYYYLYALERAGVLCRTEWLGRHAWYAEGANVLLAAQGKDGSWNGSPTDTCFAILFLKRVTRPLEDVASQDERNRK